jgi:hypothetical protein
MSSISVVLNRAMYRSAPLTWAFSARPPSASAAPQSDTAFYPDDRAVTELIDGLRDSRRFDELWARYATLPLQGSHKTVVHPELGAITLDCDILAIERADLHIVMNWAVPGTRDAQKLDTLRERTTAAAL